MRPHVFRSLAEKKLVGHAGNEIPYDLLMFVPLDVFIAFAF